MSRRWRGAALVLVLLCVTACFTRNRMATLIGPMQVSWPEISNLAEPLDDISDMDNLITTCADNTMNCDFVGMSGLWPSIKNSALFNVASMEQEELIGPGVAESLRENLRLFEEAILEGTTIRRATP